MRRVMIILMLMLLPVHLSWAAVAPYCDHEVTTPSQQHAGHHAHTALASDHLADADTDVDTDADTDAAQLDCGQCHNHCTGVLAGPVRAKAASTAEVLAAAAVAAALDQVPTPPERPQWARLA